MNEKVVAVLNHRFAIPTSVGVVVFGSGIGIGYFVGRRRAWNQALLAMSDIVPSMERQIEKDEALYSEYVENVEDLEYAMPETNVEVDQTEVLPPEAPYPDGVVEFSTAPEKPEQTEETQAQEEYRGEVLPTRTRVLNRDLPPWDYEHEREQRTDDAPYIITKAEFEADDMGYRQETLTYYAADDVLADGQEVELFGWVNMVGEVAKNFGRGSEDHNVLYVRNESMETEWEILYHSSSYAVEIQGFEALAEIDSETLRHGVRRFRDSD